MAINFNGILQPQQPQRIIAQGAPAQAPELPADSGGGSSIGGLLKGIMGMAGKGGGGGSVNAGGTSGAQGLRGLLEGTQAHPATPLQAINQNIGVGTPNSFKSSSSLGLQESFSPKVDFILQDLSKQGFKPQIAEGVRTTAQQAEKVSSGYSKTMNSKHLQGNAVDIIDSRYGWKDSKENSAFREALARSATQAGLISGSGFHGYGPHGDWAHVEFPTGRSYESRLLAQQADKYGQYNQQTPIRQPNMQSDVNQAILAAREVNKDNPVMGDIAASQAILESNLAGKPSKLAREGNNYFGIKGQGTAGTVNMGTKEYSNGAMHSQNAGFAKFNDPSESFTRHRDLMNNGIKSNPDIYRGVRDAKTPEEGFQALQKAGYATDPNYARELTRVYNQYVKPAPVKPTPPPMTMNSRATPQIPTLPDPNIPSRQLAPTQLNSLMGQQGQYSQLASNGIGVQNTTPGLSGVGDSSTNPDQPNSPYQMPQSLHGVDQSSIPQAIPGQMQDPSLGNNSQLTSNTKAGLLWNILNSNGYKGNVYG